MKDKVSDMENAVSDIDISIRSEEKELETQQSKYRKIISENIWKIAGLGLIILALAFNQNVDFSIPVWVSSVIAGFVIAVIVTYPYARWIADKLVQDSRIPIAAIDPENDFTDLEVWKVPQKPLSNMQVEGDLHTINTSKGMGYEVKQIYNKEDNSLFAKGTWYGEMTGLELKREKENVKNMYDNIVPLANKGIMYDIKMSHLVHTLASKIANIQTRQFQEDLNYKGSEIQEIIEDTVNEFQIEDKEDEIQDLEFEDLVNLEESHQEIEDTITEALANGGEKNG